MGKVFELQVGDRVLKLCFNIIFAEQLAKLLKCEATPDALMKGILELNEKSSFLMSKALVHCGVLGHDYMVGYSESVTGEELGTLIVKASPSQMADMFSTVARELGYNLNAEPQDPQEGKATGKGGKGKKKA